MDHEQERRESYLSRKIDFAVEVVQEALLGGEGTDSDNTLKKLTEPRENGRTGIRLHPSKISSCIQVPNCKAIVEVADDHCPKDERWEDNPVEWSVCAQHCTKRS
jgi:hypothetical protein